MMITIKCINDEIVKLKSCNIVIETWEYLTKRVSWGGDPNE